ncbi:MAG: helix-turn-helix domain-containing protein [Eubacteriales bacterium]|nr:helix-turn-helix domain-containing protein [Eubacteriales bacterium]
MSMTIEERIDEIDKRLQALEESDQRFILSNAAEVSKTIKRLVNQYGVHVEKSTAARILGVTRQTVYAMLEDGRIQGAYGGKRVDVRSIARYIYSGKPKNKGEKACR